MTDQYLGNWYEPAIVTLEDLSREKPGEDLRAAALEAAKLTMAEKLQRLHGVDVNNGKIVRIIGFRDLSSTEGRDLEVAYVYW